MTNYSRDDLAGEWEFKIVRSLTGAFRNPATLERMRQEESQSGWVMVEKFDNSRVRFKRPSRARDNDSRLPEGSDPYRSYYGISNIRFTLVILFIVFGFVGVVLLSVFIPLILFSANALH